ncbi:Yip1 family protein [Halostella pelagica]|uniref:Yip1 family protein n=1 Tax=Halostella pelagica TaxID=2583824 RepID=UPI00138708CC|nr:Yip1 family protein [Halostella pelagica]
MSPRTPLLRPDRYFDGRQISLARGIAVVLLVTVGLTAGVYSLGFIVTENIDGTVTVDNPDRPPENFCDGTFESANSNADCDEPATVDKDIDVFLWKAVGSVAGQMIVGVPVLWLFVGLLLYAGSWLFDGDGPRSNAWVVAAWGLVPSVVSFAAVLVVLSLTFDPVTVTAGTDPTVFRDDVIGELGVLHTVGAVFGLLGTLWGAVIWRFGLEDGRNLSGTGASIVAGAVAVFMFLFGAA